MRLGQLTRIVVDDVTFMVALNWGQLKRLQRELAEVRTENVQAGLEFVEAELLKLVRSCQGLENAEGEPVTKFTPEIIDELPVDFLQRLFQGIMQIGESAEASGPNPPAAPAASET